jgi:DNA-binding Lrp family transcriptional regulator
MQQMRKQNSLDRFQNVDNGASYHTLISHLTICRAFTPRVLRHNKYANLLLVKSSAYTILEDKALAKAFVLINTEAGMEQEVVNQLKAMKNVKEAYTVYGVYDAVAFVEADKIEDLKNAVSFDIRKLNGVRSTVTMMVAEGKKLGGSPP